MILYLVSLPDDAPLAGASVLTPGGTLAAGPDGSVELPDGAQSVQVGPVVIDLPAGLDEAYVALDDPLQPAQGGACLGVFGIDLLPMGLPGIDPITGEIIPPQFVYDNPPPLTVTPPPVRLRLAGPATRPEPMSMEWTPSLNVPVPRPKPVYEPLLGRYVFEGMKLQSRSYLQSKGRALNPPPSWPPPQLP